MHNNEPNPKIQLKPEISLLMQIQEIDKEIITLRTELESLPAKLKVIESKVAEQHTNLTTYHTKQDELRKHRRQAEIDLKTWEQQKEKLLAHQFDVKTNKEMFALQHEIEVASAKIDSFENTILEILEEEEALKEQISAAAQLSKAEEAQAETERFRVEHKHDELTEQYDECVKKRNILVKQLPEEAKEFYLNFRTKYPGNFVVPVVGGSCGGCHMRLLQDEIVKVHVARELTYCCRCLRLISYDQDFDPDNPPSVEVVDE